MARCFLTGVEFIVKDGYVLNRGDAHRLLRTFRHRAESLERLIAQLTPFDKPSTENAGTGNHARSRQHRMVCKGVADALLQAYPEIELLISWPALLTRDTRDRMQLLKDHPLYGAGISSLSDEELAPVAKLGRTVLHLIDPGRELPYGVQMAIKAGICVRHRTRRATKIVTLIRSTILGNEDLAALGVPEEAHDTVRTALIRALNEPPRQRSP